MKYKIGDKVQIRKDLNCEITCRSGVTEEMIFFAGKEAEIKKTFCYMGRESYYIDIDDGRWFWNEEMLERPTKEFKVEGFRSNNASVCLMKKDGKVIAKGVARCCPDDDYDFEFGIRLAFFRMMGLPTDELLLESEDKESTGRFKNNELIMVTDIGEVYDTYVDFIREFAPEAYDYFTFGVNITLYEKQNDVFKILTQHAHPMHNCQVLVIQNVRTNAVYMIGEDGVKHFKLEAVA